MSEDVKRFDCTNGGAAWCQGCYTMSEDEHGDYVQAEDYDALLAENERLAEALRGLLDVSDKFTGDPDEDAATWVAANDAARAALDQEGGK